MVVFQGLRSLVPSNIKFDQLTKQRPQNPK